MADEWKWLDSLQSLMSSIETVIHNFLPKITCHGTSAISFEAKELLVGATAGAICFPATIGAMELFLFAPLFLTSKIRCASSILGVIPVSIASCASAWTFLQATAMTRYLLEEKHGAYRHKVTGKSFGITLSYKMEDFVFYGVTGLCFFKLFRGKFHSVLPSHLLRPGAFSCKAIPASSTNYASAVTKYKVDLIGRKSGCHSCGTRKPLNFVADHQPPNKMVKDGQKQLFYPHCQTCSIRQGSALNHMHSAYLRIKTHPTALRLYHIWLPLPLLLMALKDYMQDEDINLGHMRNIFNRRDDDVLNFINNLQFWRRGR